MRITSTEVWEAGPCYSGGCLFDENFPEGMEVTRESLEKFGIASLIWGVRSFSNKSQYSRIVNTLAGKDWNRDDLIEAILEVVE